MKRQANHEETKCSPRMEISGEGSGTGEMHYTVKLERSSERMLWCRLITTTAHIKQYDASTGSSRVREVQGPVDVQ